MNGVFKYDLSWYVVTVVCVIFEQFCIEWMYLGKLGFSNYKMKENQYHRVCEWNRITHIVDGENQLYH